MKFDLTRFIGREHPTELPAIGGPIDMPLSPAAKESLRGPIIGGALIIGVFVVGLGVWASLAPIWGAVVAPGVVRVEANRKTLKSRDGGVIRQINVREGDSVKAGQLLLKFDDTVARAQVAIMENQYDTYRMQQARFQAESTRRSVLTPPAELAARQSDPRVAMIIQNETLVFTARQSAIEGQTAILRQRLDQLQSGQQGLKVQVDSIDQQVVLITEELKGYQTLYEKGFAPKTLILRLQRSLAEISGRRGALTAEITKNQQQAGEARLQMAQLYEQRGSEAATGQREAESRLGDVGPRLNAAREALAQTEVRAPVSGYVLNLSQYTLGGVAGPGEVLLDVVPTNTPLVIYAQVQPGDIDEVRPGMTADVTLQAYSSYRVPKIPAEVLTVSADAVSDAETKKTFFRAELRIRPDDLRKLPKGVKLYPGMPATVMIKTGKRTVMSYLIGPIGEIIGKSLREQ